MSLLSDTVFAGASSRLHITGRGGPPPPPSPQQQQHQHPAEWRNGPKVVRKSRSHAGFLTPLVQLVKDPVASLTGVVGHCRNVPDGAVNPVHFDRRPILYLRMKDVGFSDWLSGFHMLTRANLGRVLRRMESRRG